MKEDDDEMKKIRERLMQTGTRSYIGGGLEIYHIYPLNDLKEHNTGGGDCWCNPTYDGDLIVHNSMDERESYEQGRKMQ